MQNNQLSQSIYAKPVTLKNILSFAFPTIAMSIFMSIYTMVDGLFVSNLLGTNALSAINLTAPIIQLVTAISTMLATGGSAAVMKKMGEQKQTEANQDFTFLILVNVAVGLLMFGLGCFFTNRVFSGTALSDTVADYCKEYLRYYLLFTVPILLMNNFALYLIASGKSTLSFICSVAGGITNIVLDYLFLAVFHLGIGSAAVSTGLGYSITTVVGVIVFSRRSNLLHFKKPFFRLKVLLLACTNGCSEMATTLVSGIITLVFNWSILNYAGEDGVAAVTIIMYVLMLASSLYSGFAYGVAPLISYYDGAQDYEKLKKLVRTSLTIISCVTVITVFLSFVMTEPLVSIFAHPDNPVYALAVTGNRICSFSLLFIGFNIFASGLFTALSNGLISAILAFSRSFIFMLIPLLILPALFGITGIWLATPLAECAAICLSFFMFAKYQQRYHY